MPFIPSAAQVSSASFGYGTSLPASPISGETYILVDSVTDPTYQWVFRYNTGSANTDKWEFMGGAPATSEVLTGESTSSTSYVDLTTVGPSITVPRAGVYQVSLSAFTFNNDGVASNFSTVKVGGAAAGDGNSLQHDVSGANKGLTNTRVLLLTFAASDVAKVQYRVSAGIGSFLNRNLSIVPIRVS